MTDESYIKLTIEIAKKGIGNVSPNPLVGCVIVKNDRILSAGYHEKYGENHAEINAFNSTTENVEGATLYVNLEPCSHFGKTPPCVDAIIQKKIKRVVVGTLDINPIVSGKGVQVLIENGIEVKVGVLEKECLELNRFFFKYISAKIPYVTLKAAQTLDGKIADLNGESKWITSKPSRRYVHLLRSKYDCVLVGSGTVKKDDPLLTVRFIEGRDPQKIILDSKLRINLNRKLFENGNSNSIIVTGLESKIKINKIKKLENLGCRILFVRSDKAGNINLKSALKELYKLKINSILVEGGSRVFNSFVKKNLFDEIRLFISPKLLGGGLSLISDIGVKDINKSKKLRINSFEKIGDDLVLDLRKL